MFLHHLMTNLLNNFFQEILLLYPNLHQLLQHHTKHMHHLGQLDIVNCQYCLMEYTPDDLSMKMYPEEYLEHTHFRKGAGCEQCHDTGYAGRAAITELLVVDEEVRQAVIEKRPTREIQEIAIAAGMMTLWENGMQKVMRGECPLEEVLHVCAADLM